MMIIVMLLLSYLIGAFPSGFVIGKLFFKKDIRQFGSGNTGATNSFRVLGRPAGFLVTFLDIFKGFITVFFPLWLPVHADGPISTFFYKWFNCWLMRYTWTCLSCLFKIPRWQSCCN